MGFVTYRIGRSRFSDLVIESPEVSRRHVELTCTSSGRLFLVRCVAAEGAFVWRNGEWAEIQQGYVSSDEHLRIGTKSYLIGDLLKALDHVPSKKGPIPAGEEPVSVFPRRQLNSGEVELVRRNK